MKKEDNQSPVINPMITYTPQPASPLEEASRAETYGSVFDDNGSNAMAHDTDNSLYSGEGNTLSQD